jgi:soluble lytic murein transglycosylase-like protein
MPRLRHFLATGYALLFMATQAAAGDATGAGGSPYRLRLERADAFRLQRAGPQPLRRAVAGRIATKPYASQIQRAAREAKLDPALVHAVVRVESAYDPGARSPKGALGLMQVMPQTALRYGVSDPARSTEINLDVGTRYLRDLVDMFGGRLELALAAYNAGEHAVLRHGGRIPPFRETRRYVDAVLHAYRAEHGVALPPVMLGEDYPRDVRLNAEVLHSTTLLARP